MEITPFSMISYAVGLFIITLLTAHIITPLTTTTNKLGQRPIGTGVLTYSYSQLFTPFTGCWGYDPSLGSFNPLWRLSFHLCGVIILSSFIILLGHDDSIMVLMIRSALIYMISFGLYWKNSLGVSHPGGAREHKIRRMPKWDDKSTNALESTTVTSSPPAAAATNNNWRCAVAQDSHRSTLKQFNLDPKAHGENGIKNENNQIGLCGEPFGRQIWTTESNDFNDDDGWTKVIPHLDLIKEMAKGGRAEFKFNPSQNPNSADMIFREQMITNFVANGGSLPDISYDGKKTIKDAMKKAVHFLSMLQTEDGHWAGDYGGPHFLMPGLIITW